MRGDAPALRRLERASRRSSSRSKRHAAREALLAGQAPSGRTPLHAASSAAARECVRVLLHAGACAATRDAAGDTPLHALRGGSEAQRDVSAAREVAGLLEDAGADRLARNALGLTPADAASARQQAADEAATATERRAWHDRLMEEAAFEDGFGGGMAYGMGSDEEPDSDSSFWRESYEAFADEERHERQRRAAAAAEAAAREAEAMACARARAEAEEAARAKGVAGVAAPPPVGVGPPAEATFAQRWDAFERAAARAKAGKAPPLRAADVPLPGGSGAGAADEAAVARACLAAAAADAAVAGGGRRKALRRLMLRLHPDKLLAAHACTISEATEERAALTEALNSVALVLTCCWKQAKH